MKKQVEICFHFFNVKLFEKMARKVLKAMLKEQKVLPTEGFRPNRLQKVLLMRLNINKKTKTVNNEKLLRKCRTIIVNPKY